MQLLTQEQLSSKDPENYAGKTRGPVIAPVITSQHNLGQITYPLSAAFSSPAQCRL